MHCDAELIPPGVDDTEYYYRRYFLAIRFYFDLENGRQILRDTDGIDANSPAEAFMAAQSVLEEMSDCDDLLILEDGWQLIIRNEIGVALISISLDGSTSINCDNLVRKAPLLVF